MYYPTWTPDDEGQPCRTPIVRDPRTKEQMTIDIYGPELGPLFARDETMRVAYHTELRRLKADGVTAAAAEIYMAAWEAAVLGCGKAGAA